ncbi:hypothetical protein G7L40_16200 [Paenibacillus polymyxa]|uniref:Uncharacterized protein n=1 Tax=Paenibacillus polymyxa TaxID=1406 RepID=A0A378Y2Y1_PAEPO|nr:hypothetical protein [Paenibacillus polymyxa]MBE7901189.1 hypothetical protein [Paenibacillus polymyxa]MBG9767113.1 hypothetical protein [Paenibacillus polymyxa]MCC3261745.1 hypothetical protein [Paenibacillus polymyxa]QPK54080.1 hypothetical protein G7035_16235 [Paenibacillus polymyxa]QPK59170.1 hypothetical protein G7L40_16200 [Paenibacillus polymyxa]
MGVRKKYKRKIIRANRLFYWYVEPDIDDEGIIKLHILAENKKFLVTYEVGQHSIKNKTPIIVIIGKEFEGWTKEYIGYRRVITPNWNDEIITPNLIGEIIDWCLLRDKEIKVVNWKGELIE